MLSINHKTLKLKIKTINSNTFDINIDSDKRVIELKKELEILIKIEKNKQRLIFQGKVMKNDLYLIDYKLGDGDVIHLVESQGQVRDNSTIVNGTESNRREESEFNFFNSLLHSYEMSNEINYTQNSNNHFNNTNYLNSIFRDNNSNSLHPIPDSFKNLMKRSTFNKHESIEVIKQNLNNIKEIINNSISFNLENNGDIKKLFKINNAELIPNPTKHDIIFKVGQWVDVKDSVDQWVEGQILDVNNEQVYITFNGWANDWNEWISINSPRLALFRTFTLQSPFSKYLSPFPNAKNESSLIFKDFQDFDKLDSFGDIINFLEELKIRARTILEEREKLYDKNYSNMNYYDLTKIERNYYFHLMQLSPIMDRIGRILTDYASYLFNFSFKEFEDDTVKFRTNTNYRNITNYNSLEEKLNKKIHSFKDLIQIPTMRNPGEVADSTNMTRPRVGIIIGMNNPIRNNNEFRSNNSFNTNNTIIPRRENLIICNDIKFSLYANDKSINFVSKNEKQSVESFSYFLWNSQRDIHEIKKANFNFKDKIVIEARDKDEINSKQISTRLNNNHLSNISKLSPSIVDLNSSNKLVKENRNRIKINTNDFKSSKNFSQKKYKIKNTKS